MHRNSFCPTREDEKKSASHYFQRRKSGPFFGSGGGVGAKKPFVNLLPPPTSPGRAGPKGVKEGGILPRMDAHSRHRPPLFLGVGSRPSCPIGKPFGARGGRTTSPEAPTQHFSVLHNKKTEQEYVPPPSPLLDRDCLLWAAYHFGSRTCPPPQVAIREGQNNKKDFTVLPSTESFLQRNVKSGKKYL